MSCVVDVFLGRMSSERLLLMGVLEVEGHARKLVGWVEVPAGRTVK